MQHALMLRLLFFTAVRVSELCNIEVADVDLENCKVFVNQGKGSKDRYVLFGKSFATALRTHILAGFLVRHLPPPVQDGDPLEDPLGGGPDLLAVAPGEAAVGFGKDGPAPSLGSLLLVPVRREPVGVDPLLLLHSPPRRETALVLVSGGERGEPSLVGLLCCLVPRLCYYIVSSTRFSTESAIIPVRRGTPRGRTPACSRAR